MKTPPQDEVLRYLILSVLRDNRGPMLMSEVYVKVRLLRENLNHPFTERELKPVGHTRKEPTWTNDIRQACRPMVTDKRIRRTRGSFVGWEITQKGLEWLEASAWLVASIVEDDPIENDI
jgi:hypothetical protein